MTPEKEDEIRQDAMLDLAHSHATETMRGWFLKRYEDPVHNTPYDSGEGGYIYIWGGPYDAREVLFDEFGGTFDEDIIEEVASDLEQICSDWARIPTAEDFDFGKESVSEHLSRASRSFHEIRKMLEREDDAPFLNALLYAHVISVLEAFLYEAFASALKVRRAFRAFVESDPAFKNEKICLSDIYATLETIETKVNSHLQTVVFHRLEKVQRMFRDSLNVEMPTGIAELLRAIGKRHDIVHRNCVHKDGNKFTVTKADVTSLVDFTDKFIHELSEKMDALQSIPESVSDADTRKSTEPF